MELLTRKKHIAAQKVVFTPYTHVTKTNYGQPCLSGCNNQSECAINWKGDIAKCVTFDPAPIYMTSRMKDPIRKYCISNCGRFGEKYEWCITTDHFEWDYCSSQESTNFLPSLAPVAHTRLGDSCTSECGFNNTKYNWCYFKGLSLWEYCAPPPFPRVPILRDDFYIGRKMKGNCDGFLKYVSVRLTHSTAADAPDKFVNDLADAIEANGKVIKVNDNTSVKSYVLVEIGSFSVPVVIRARITNRTIEMGDESTMPVEIEKKINEQMVGSNVSYTVAPLIGSQLGGPNRHYNVVPRSINWKYDEWYDMELAVKSWCQTTGGSVDMTVVVFYEDVNSTIPEAFGVSLVYKYSDGDLFVDCREKVHFNIW